ncbi:WD repeat-containing protein 70-like [Salvia splendens]|uniref:WD repeat-containing protein 70-like n=1 Tax=Salvia splendens TaxID=180675 RepID=UPI001C26805B|nr:WD repeat-containing protein 70-like [Salvia splendens]
MKLIHTKERELISLCVSDWINSFRNSNPRNSNRGGDVAALIGPPRPPAVLDEEDEDEDSRIGQPRPPPGAAGDDDDGLTIGPPRPPPGSTDSDEDKDEDADEEDEDPGYRVPMSNEIVLKGHTKGEQGLVFLRFKKEINGIYYMHIRCLSSGKSMTAMDLHWVSLSRKTDMYIRDLKNTKGHISGLTCGEWHPKDKQTILTSSEDGSLRIWDVNDFKSQKQMLVSLKDISRQTRLQPDLQPVEHVEILIGITILVYLPIKFPRPPQQDMASRHMNDV